MILPSILCHTILVISLSLFSRISSADDEQTTTKEEPPFPQAFDSSSQGQIHIVSESFDSKHGYETIEEYVHLPMGKAVFTSSSKYGHSTTLVDTTTDTIYRYKPYSCLTLKPSELVSVGEVGIWHKIVTTNINNNRKHLHLYEVSAAWLNAIASAKTYSTTDFVYSTMNDGLKRDAHKWTVHDGSRKVHFYFVDNAKSNSDSSADVKQPSMSLSLIEEESEDGKIERTINIISVEYYLPNEIYNSLLQVPLGYGCRANEIHSDFAAKHRIIVTPDGEKRNRLRIEATATKFPASADMKRSTDTISLDILLRDHFHYQAVRQRNSNKDIKVVSDFVYNVQYIIDLNRGSCSITHIDKYLEKHIGHQLEFNNGLSVNFDFDNLLNMFDENLNCQIVKITNMGELIEYVYQECESNELLFGRRPTRLIRKYAIRKDDPSNAELKSVTAWILDDLKVARKLLESYHFYIIESDTIDDRLELMRLFDVSEECYFNNNKMKYGVDYAWLELTYPLMKHQIDILAANPLELKTRIHESYELLFNNILRMPRIELMFTDSSVIVRTMMIDIPSLIYVYDSYQQRSLIEDNSMIETTVDVEHCAQLCKLQHCKAMSYCSSNYKCIIGTDLIRKEDIDRRLTKSTGCVAYLIPDDDEILKYMYLESLQYLIAKLQDEDLGSISLPKVPEEILYPISVTGLDQYQFSLKQAEYIHQIYIELAKQDKYLPSIVVVFFIDQFSIYMIPSKFEIEQDPMEEFSLDNKETIDVNKNSVAAFHEGLALYRYKIGAFREPGQNDAQLYSRLNYDQCALACADSRCSSFSYCKHRQECIITNVFEIETAKNGLIVADSDCFIAQRDFLNKFNEFTNVFRPPVYKKNAIAHNPSECAHNCVVESDFNCLAFDYCKNDDGLSQCFYQDNRLIYTGSSEAIKTANGTGTVTRPPFSSAEPATKATETGCSHFSRSYLADFIRIGYRQIDDTAMSKLRTTRFRGQSVDKCADICINELNDCTAFQFCFDPNDNISKQKCIMIESKPEGDEQDYRVIQDKEGNIIEESSKFFVLNHNCHLFAMRRDSSEAQMRDVAFKPLGPAELAAEKNINQSGGLTIGGAFVLYLTTTAMFALIGCGLVIARHHSPYVRDRYERVRAYFGFY